MSSAAAVACSWNVLVAEHPHPATPLGAKTMGSITPMDTTTMSMLLAMAGPQGWAELPTGILHAIIHLLSSTRDVLAFIATCPTWRAAFMEAKPTFCKLLPPLMIQSCAQLSNDAHHSGVHHMWQLMDPANPSLRFYRPVPATIPPGMEFVGCSYGHAIFADLSVSETGGNITMIDVFTGVQVSPPPCPVLAKAAARVVHFIDLLCCTLTAPVSSPKACLLVSTNDIVGRLLVWRVGSDDWQHARTAHAGIGPIDQIVVFGDKIIALDIDLSLFTVHLGDDKLGRSIRPLLIVEEDDDGMVNREALLNARLVVVCGDKLALVGSPSPDDWETLVYFHLDGLDSPTTEPPRWSPVPELEGALFISGGHGVQTVFEGWYGRWVLSRARPERWGGRTGHVAFAGHANVVYPFPTGRLLPSWVSPSVLSPDG